MKTATMTSQIDTLLSTVFQPSVPTENAVECVDRMLSAFRKVDQAIQPNAYTFGTLACEDWLAN